VKRSFILHPGTILATVVLAGTVGGSVYAASSGGPATIGSAQIKNGSIRLADISPKARKALRGARGPAGAPAVAGAGGTGSAGPAGAAGPVGPAGTATAYATVSSTGQVDAARSKNLVVTIPPGGGVGIFCVRPAAGSGISTSRPAVVTPTQGPGLSPAKDAQISAVSQIGCDIAEGWPVVTHQFDSGTKTFPQTDVGFMIIVP